MKIKITDLDDGIHEFDYEMPVGSVKLPDRDNYLNPIFLHLYIDRLENLFRFKFKLKTQSRYTCDRCLDDFNTDLDEESEQLYQLGHSDLDSDDEITILPENSHEIDITKAIQDTFMINRPMQNLCNEECKGLCPKCGKNLNFENCVCTDDKIDPRLLKLKSLLS
jgi:uncharacterized protein